MTKNMKCKIDYIVARTSCKNYDLNFYNLSAETKSLEKKTAEITATTFTDCETKFWRLPKIKELVADGASVSIIKMQIKNE